MSQRLPVPRWTVGRALAAIVVVAVALVALVFFVVVALAFVGLAIVLGLVFYVRLKWRMRQARKAGGRPAAPGTIDARFKVDDGRK